MCKSQAEGGQRCSGHARERRDALIAKWDDNIGALESGGITRGEWDAYEAQVNDAIIDYVSTPDGAAEQRALLSRYESALTTATDDDYRSYLHAITSTRTLIDEGAVRAQVNREVENAWRADHGFKPLATPVPQTLAQEQAAADAEAARAAATAAWAADPLGLRAEQAHLRPVTAQPATYRSPTEARDGMLNMQAVAQIQSDIEAPQYTEPARGIRGRLTRRSENAAATERGTRFGPAFTAAVDKYEGRFDARQIERAAQLLTLHAPATADTQQFVAAHLDSTLDRAAWTLQPDVSVLGETHLARSTSGASAAASEATGHGYGVEAEFDLPSDRPTVREPNAFERAQERIAFLDESDLPKFRTMIAGGM